MATTRRYMTIAEEHVAAPSDIAWTDPDHAADSTGITYAAIDVASHSTSRKLLLLTGENEFSLPADAVVTNIKAELLLSGTARQTDQIGITLVVDGDDASKSTVVGAVGSTPGWVSVNGSLTDLGATGLLVDQINDPTFGVGILIDAPGFSVDANIYDARMTITFSSARVSVTEDELAEYLGIDESALPADASRLIDRATDMVDYVTMQRYDVDEADELAAVKKAVCAQVEYWIANPEGESVEYQSGIQTKTIGRTTITWFGKGSSGGSGGASSGQVALAPRARRVLFLAGLLYAGASCGTGLSAVPVDTNFDEFGI